MQKLKMIFFIYYNHFLLVFWKIKPCIITGIMQGLPFPIITYQVITGNYSFPRMFLWGPGIITYQVITGNYSYNVLWESSDNILKKYKWKRKSLAITPSDVNIFSQTSETLNGTAFKNIISCAKAAHDRHSPFAECINAFFSLALIISQSQKNNTLNKRDHI